MSIWRNDVKVENYVFGAGPPEIFEHQKDITVLVNSRPTGIHYASGIQKYVGPFREFKSPLRNVCTLAGSRGGNSSESNFAPETKQNGYVDPYVSEGETNHSPVSYRRSLPPFRDRAGILCQQKQQK